MGTENLDDRLFRVVGDVEAPALAQKRVFGVSFEDDARVRQAIIVVMPILVVVHGIRDMMDAADAVFPGNSHVRRVRAADRLDQLDFRRMSALADPDPEMAVADFPAICPRPRRNEIVDPEIVDGLKLNFMGECTEVGMYLAMSRQADREGFPEVAEAYKRIAFEEAEHAAKFAELLGEVLTDSTKKNLEMRVDAENGACAGKMGLAKLAKELGLDAIHDTVHEMAKDEARHGRAFEGLLKRFFK